MPENKIISCADYYPFGTVTYGRDFSFSSGYKYGFNGKEKDDEVKGNNNSYDYGMRMYDSRLGRFMSVDPLTRSFPFYSPYSYAGNNPIMNIDLDGLENQQSTQPETATQALPKAPNMNVILSEASQRRADKMDRKVEEIQKSVDLNADLKNVNKEYIRQLINQKLSFDSDGNPIVRTVVSTDGKSENKYLATAKEIACDAGEQVLDYGKGKAQEWALKKAGFAEGAISVIGKVGDVAALVLTPVNDPNVSSDHVWPAITDEQKEQGKLTEQINNAVDRAIGKVVLGKQDYDPKKPIKMKDTTPVNDDTKVAKKPFVKK